MSWPRQPFEPFASVLQVGIIITHNQISPSSCAANMPKIIPLHPSDGDTSVQITCAEISASHLAFDLLEDSFTATFPSKSTITGYMDQEQDSMMLPHEHYNSTYGSEEFLYLDRHLRPSNDPSVSAYDDFTSPLESSTIDPRLLNPTSPYASDNPSSSITSFDMSEFLSIEAGNALMGETDDLIRSFPQSTAESSSQSQISQAFFIPSHPRQWKAAPRLLQEDSPLYSWEKLSPEDSSITFESHQAEPHGTLPFIPTVEKLQRASPSSGSTSPNPNELLDYGNINGDGTWHCAFPDCTSRAVFTRGCDLRKHYRRHSKYLFCRHKGCPQSTTGGFSSKKDRARHEAKHNPDVPCDLRGCARVFSRVDNMKDHVGRVHRKCN